MGVQCGVDIVEIERIKKSIESLGDSFRNRVFTVSEIEYCENRKAARYMSYAARFAAKEAVSKAFGTGISRGIGLKDIEILNDDNGRPYVVLHGSAKEVYKSIYAEDISLSLSHCENYAVASVCIQTENKKQKTGG